MLNQTLQEQATDLSSASFTAPKVYHNPIPAAVGVIPIIGIDPEDGVLKYGIIAVRRGIQPKLGELALPGGYIEYEDWRDAMLREIGEEADIHISDRESVSLVAVNSVSNGERLIIFGSTAPIYEDNLSDFVPNSETLERVILFSPQELAFPTHTEVLVDQLSKFKKRDALAELTDRVLAHLSDERISHKEWPGISFNRESSGKITLSFGKDEITIGNIPQVKSKEYQRYCRVIIRSLESFDASN